MNKSIYLYSALLFALMISGCTDKTRIIDTSQPALEEITPYRPYEGDKGLLAVGEFESGSDCQNTVPADSCNRLSEQSRTILITHLQQTNVFSVFDNINLESIKKASPVKGRNKALKNLIHGELVEFNYGETDSAGLFSIFSTEKTQSAYAKVRLNVINIQTGKIRYSAEGTGKYKLSNDEIFNLSQTDVYSPEIADKVINLAVRQAVGDLFSGAERNAWQPVEPPRLRDMYPE